MDNLLKSVKALVEEGKGRTFISRELGISESKATRLIRQVRVGVAPKSKVEEEFIPLVRRGTKKQFKKRQYPDSGSILIVPDAHAKPTVGNERFTKLGRLINDIRPDAVVQIGDAADMPSLSSYDVGKKSFEGRRYSDDVTCLWDALERINKEIRYDPIKIVTLGNHENRINKAINSDPKLDGTISTDDLRLEEFGWEVYPFLEPCYLMGVLFQHYLVSGSLDRAIGGENVGRNILKKYHTSAFTGHSHLLNLAWESDAKGRKMMAGSTGCYFDHIEEWQSKAAQNQFWRGVLLLEEVDNGSIGNFSLITLESIMRDY